MASPVLNYGLPLFIQVVKNHKKNQLTPVTTTPILPKTAINTGKVNKGQKTCLLPKSAVEESSGPEGIRK